MKILSLTVLTTLALSPLAFAVSPAKTSPMPVAASPSPTPTPKDEPIGPLKNQKDKVSYAIGLDIGTTLKRQMIDVDQGLLNKGMQDGISGAKPILNDQQVKEVMSAFQKDMMEKQAARRKAEGEKNAKEGKKFLDENKKKPGIKTTTSGLQYQVIAQGTGPKPKETDTVEVNYRGTLINGTEFDSSYKRGKPAKFPVNRVIKGWTEALQLMPVGSKYKFYIPADLGYGERGAGGEIESNATLIFDVELLGIAPEGTSPAPKPGMIRPGMTPVKPMMKPKASPGSATSPSPTAKES